MFKSKEKNELDERLDRLGREVVRASAADETEALQAASSPYLYTRLSARLATERERREALERWPALMLFMRRTILAMSLVAMIALGLFWFARIHNSLAYTFSDAAFFDAHNAGVERVMFAERGGLSNDEVLATIMSDEKDAGK